MLKINLDDKVKSLDGRPLQVGTDVPTVGELLYSVMQAREKDESFEKTLENMKIAKKLNGEGEVELTDEEIARIKRLAHIQSNPIFFAVVAIVEP